MHCQLLDTRQLWKNNYEILSEDIETNQRKRLHMKDLQIHDKQIEVYTLIEIESIVLKMGKRLKDILACHIHICHYFTL